MTGKRIHLDDGESTACGRAYAKLRAPIQLTKDTERVTCKMCLVCIAARTGALNGVPAAADALEASKGSRRELLLFVARFVYEKGYCPTIREMAVGIDLSSTSNVKMHMERLRSLGLLAYEDGAGRTARPTDIGWQVAGVLERGVKP